MLLVVWIIPACCVTAALSYGELAAMMPGRRAYFICGSLSPLWGFLYGWTLFMVIQTGTIAAVVVAFGRFLGVLWPAISESQYLIAPVHVSSGYALSLSTAQLVGVLLIAVLTWTNTRGLDYGKMIQNVFTTAKTGAIVVLILLGLFAGWNAVAVSGTSAICGPRAAGRGRAGADGRDAFGLFVAVCVSQTGSLFSADAWNNITFTAGEVKNPRRNIPLSLALGTAIVIGLYLLANVAYLVTLPLSAIQTAPSDRVATATLNAIFPGYGAILMAAAIMVSTFGAQRPDLAARAPLRDGSVCASSQAGTLTPPRTAWLCGCRASGRRSWCCRAPTTRRPAPTGTSTATCSTTSSRRR